MNETALLPQQAIDEFKQMYFSDYRVMLSDKEATEKAYQLFNCLKAVTTKNPIDSNNKKVQL